MKNFHFIGCISYNRKQSYLTKINQFSATFYIFLGTVYFTHACS